jgi:hypothetical protein
VPLLGVFAPEVAAEAGELTPGTLVPTHWRMYSRSLRRSGHDFVLEKVSFAYPVRCSAKVRKYLSPRKSGSYMWLMSVHHACPGGVCSRISRVSWFSVFLVGARRPLARCWMPLL